MFKNMLILTLFFVTATCCTGSNNIKVFPIEHYSQNADLWLNPKDADYNDNLLDYGYQQKRLYELKHNYFGTGKNDTSPWSGEYVQSLLKTQDTDNVIADSILSTLEQFDNSRQSDKELIKFGANYRPYSSKWLKGIQDNISVLKFNYIKYTDSNRAIATINLQLRALPTNDPAYYSDKIAGEGYPFDNLQVSAVYAGTPLYILGTSIDKQWSLVLAPEYIGWVSSGGVARVDNQFILQWQNAAYTNLAAIKQSNVAVVDEVGQYQFSGYVGMIFPVAEVANNSVKILIPFKQANGTAGILYSKLSNINAALLPLKASPANFAAIFKALQRRPYGWGGLGFYNDCSSEMKAIFTMFGFFMPRNSIGQTFAGKMVDISSLSASQREQYLIKNALPLLTLVRIKGHVLLYIGSYEKKPSGEEFAMTYQQMWGMSPKDRSIRYVIGQSVFFPLLTKYPEGSDLVSELDNKVFQLVYLNQLPQVPFKQDLYQLLGL
ncbi:MAG: hypothetical protein QG673_450 [Pseudomonadota bacterium]|nr:hypothetical protein [Pseudomonadota bacterium]